MCETSEEAADVVAKWEAGEGHSCEIGDLFVKHGGEDVLAPDPEGVFPMDERRDKAKS